MHSVYAERDITSVKIGSIHSEGKVHSMDTRQIYLTGPAQDMKKFIDAKRAACEKSDFAKVRITIDLEEPGESCAPIPLLPNFPLLNDVFCHLCI